jgi:hypothetical protein
MMLQARLGLRAWRSCRGRSNPAPPHGIDGLRLEGLRVGEGLIDLAFERQGQRIAAFQQPWLPAARRYTQPRRPDP